MGEVDGGQIRVGDGRGRADPWAVQLGEGGGTRPAKIDLVMAWWVFPRHLDQ